MSIFTLARTDVILFQELSQQLHALWQECHEKANSLELDRDILYEHQRQLEHFQSQLLYEPISAAMGLHLLKDEMGKVLPDEQHTTKWQLQIPTPHKAVPLQLLRNIYVVLNILLDATMISKKIVDDNTQNIALYKNISYTLTCMIWQLLSRADIATVALQFVELYNSLEKNRTLKTI